MTRKTDSDLDSIESPFAQGPGLFHINQSKVLGESTDQWHWACQRDIYNFDKNEKYGHDMLLRVV